MKSQLKTSNNAFPFIETLQGYDSVKGKADFFAGLTVAIVAAPQAMAYALIAGFSPVYGLYTSIFPVIITALWGSSRYIVAGPTNALCMLVYSAMAQIYIGSNFLQNVPESERIQYLLIMTIVSGIFQMLIGFLRLGKFTRIISHSVILGFASGAYILIGLGQLKTFLGVDFVSPHSSFELMTLLFHNIKNVNFYTLSTGILTLVSLVSIRKKFPKAPYALLALTLVSAIHSIFAFSSYGVETCPVIPKGLPSFFIPSSGLLSEMYLHRISFVMPILTFALIASIETITIGKAMAKERKDEFSPDKELIAGGLGNIVSGFSFGLPSCGSFSRSAVNFANNAQTRFAAVFSAIFILGFLLLFGGIVSYIPLASLSALLIYISYNMLKVDEIKYIFKSSKTETIIFISTFLSIFVLGLAESIFIGIFVSLILSKGLAKKKK